MPLGFTALRTRRRSPLFYGWIIVAVFAVTNFTESAEVYPVIAVLLKPMTQEFGWSRTAFTLATSLGTLLGGVAGPFVGPMVDRYGPKWIMVVSYAVLGFLFIAMAFITEIWHWYAIQISARFLSQGVIGLASSVLIPNWFVRQRARAIAIGGMGGRLGNSVTPIYVQAIITMFTWREAVVTAGLLILAVSILPCVLFLKQKPEDMGLLPDGDSQEDYEHAREAQAKAQAEARAAGSNAEIGIVPGDVSYPLREVLRMSSFYLLMGATVSATLVGPAMNLHMIPYFTDIGLSAEMAVLVTTTLFLASAPGTLAGAFLIERFGIRPVVIVDGVLSGLWFFILLAIRSPLLVFIWAATQGLIQGASNTVRQVLFADYYGRRSLGSIRGIQTPVRLGSNAVGPTMAALAFDIAGNYVAVFSVFGVLRMVSAFLIALARPPAGSAASLPRGKGPKVEATKSLS